MRDALLPERQKPPADPIPRRRPDPANGGAGLTESTTNEIEAMAAEIYQRDYLAFGFGPWR